MLADEFKNGTRFVTQSGLVALSPIRRIVGLVSIAVVNVALYEACNPTPAMMQL